MMVLNFEILNVVIKKINSNNQVNGTLNLPTNVLIATIRKYRDQLHERFERHKNIPNEPILLSQPTTLCAKPSGSGIRANRPRPTRIIPLKPYRERINFQKVIVCALIKHSMIHDTDNAIFIKSNASILSNVQQPFQNAFLQNLEFRSDEVQQYEDDRLQYYGRKMIPLQTLTENAIKNMRTIQKQQSGQPKSNASEIKDPSFDDWLLVELTKWFNESFFTWIDSIPCKVCGKVDGSKAGGSLVENDVRVEVRNNCILSLFIINHSNQLFIHNQPSK